MTASSKYYILVMEQSYISLTHRVSAPEGLHKVLEDPSGGEWVEILQGDLGAQSLEEFAATHKPVYSGSTPVFDGWASRDDGLEAVQSTPLSYEGSNTSTITLSGGVAGSEYSIVVSKGVLCNVSEGALDGSGEAVLTIKNVSATSGYVMVRPRGHSDFEDLTHDIEFEDWSP